MTTNNKALADLEAKLHIVQSALLEAALAYEAFHVYDHREWHFDYDDVEPKDCPLCQETTNQVTKWKELAGEATIGDGVPKADVPPVSD